ncbi:ALF repeat-containing protein, partial [Escherichia coli]|uniref:ALF repeat-containing protein n=1 Tax=Escherichia coli TaxID=562 RepID=UPI003F46F0B3
NDSQAAAVVKVLGESGVQLKTAAEAARGGDPAAVRAFLAALYRHGALDPKRLGVIAEAGRTTSAMNDPVAGMNRFLKQYEDLLAR